MHLDLAVTGDRAGIAMAHIPSFSSRERVDELTGNTKKEWLPRCRVDFCGGIKAPPGGEIDFQEIRDLIIELNDQRGFNVKLVTMDQFQSTDMRQILRSMGYICARMSIDRTTSYIVVDYDKEEGFRRVSTGGDIAAPMTSVRELVYEGRFSSPHHEILEKEIRGAEKNYKTGKVDHPKRGSIDVLQAVAGACYNAINNEHYFPETEQEGLDSIYLDEGFYGPVPQNVGAEDDHAEDAWYESADQFQETEL